MRLGVPSWTVANVRVWAGAADAVGAVVRRLVEGRATRDNALAEAAFGAVVLDNIVTECVGARLSL